MLLRVLPEYTGGTTLVFKVPPQLPLLVPDCGHSCLSYCTTTFPNNPHAPSRTSEFPWLGLLLLPKGCVSAELEE